MHAPQEAQEHLQIKAGPLNATAEAPAQTQKTEPGFQEQKDQQLEGMGHHEDSDLWPPSPASVQSPP